MAINGEGFRLMWYDPCNMSLVVSDGAFSTREEAFWTMLDWDAYARRDYKIITNGEFKEMQRAKVIGFGTDDRFPMLIPDDWHSPEREHS